MSAMTSFPAPAETASNPFDILTQQEKLQAMSDRTSVRAYVDRPIEEEKLAQLREFIAWANGVQDDVELRLHGPYDDAGQVCGIVDEMFAGTFHWFLSVGYDKNVRTDEVCGWLGEKAVLLATHLGLGSCWVLGSYRPDLTAEAIGGERQLQGIVPLGYELLPTPEKQCVIRGSIRHHVKSVEEMTSSSEPYESLPDWFKAGMDAVVLAPSAVNQQPVIFSYENGEASASYGPTTERHQAVDYGIAELHFHLGAGERGAWEAGDHGVYRM